MTDGMGRTIDYLRISVTDKCNLRCRYCMPEGGVCNIAHEELLRLEEIYRVVSIMERIGIKKIRLTGGEPLVRKNLLWLIEQIKGLEGIREITMTTNGILFGSQAKQLKAAGLTSVNISLDTLDAKQFAQITGAEQYEKAYGAVQEALKQHIPVKINCVPCREFHGQNLTDVAGLAKDQPIDVRFIELMPIGCGKAFHGISSEEVLQQLENVYGKSTPCHEKRGNGPARYVSFAGFQGKVGFISPMSHQFCSTCNRVRLTADGILKLCLHYDHGIDLKALLRSGAGDEEIKTEILKALQTKPAAHDFYHEAALQDTDTRKMVQIGG